MRGPPNPSKLVRDKGSFYVVFASSEGSFVLDEEGERLEPHYNVLEDYPYLKARDTSREVIVREGPGYDLAEVDGKKVYGRALFREGWIGEVLPFYDVSSGKVIDLVTGSSIVDESGTVLPVFSNRCGGVTGIKLFLVNFKGTRLIEIGPSGETKVLKEVRRGIEQVTPSGTAFKCVESECFYFDCEGNVAKIKGGFALVSNAVIAKDHVVYELLRSGHHREEVNRVLAMNFSGYPKTPPRPLKVASLIDARGYEVLATGFMNVNGSESWCLTVIDLRGYSMVYKWSLCRDYPVFLEDEVLFDSEGNLATLGKRGLKKIELASI